MKMLYAGLLALGTTIAAVPTFAPALAHQQGPVCRYDQVDRDGDVKTVNRYCHHIPGQYQQRPRAGLTLYFDLGSGGWYFASQPRHAHWRGGRQELVCLVTFFKRSQVEAGADKNVAWAQVLPRRVAERRDGPHDRHRIFDYGSNRETRDTCRYLNNINNA